MATAKQIAWRKKFARMAKAGAFAKGGAKKKRNVTHPSSRKLAAFAKTKTRRASLSTAKKPATKRKATAKKNPLSCIKNGKRIYGAAAQAVLAKRNGGVKRKTTAKPTRRRNVEGYRDITGFHPIRGGKGYSGTRAREYGSHIEAVHAARVRSGRPARRGKYARNPGEADLYKEFQGRPTERELNLIVPEGSPAGGYALGELTTIETDTETIEFKRGEAWLCADNKNNLYIGVTKGLGGEFSANEFLGIIKKISYITVKAHLDNKEIEYVHKLGEEGGEKPALITNGFAQLCIVGGDYFITAEGIRN